MFWCVCDLLQTELPKLQGAVENKESFAAQVEAFSLQTVSKFSSSWCMNIQLNVNQCEVARAFNDDMTDACYEANKDSIHQHHYFNSKPSTSDKAATSVTGNKSGPSNSRQHSMSESSQQGHSHQRNSAKMSAAPNALIQAKRVARGGASSTSNRGNILISPLSNISMQQVVVLAQEVGVGVQPVTTMLEIAQTAEGCHLMDRGSNLLITGVVTMNVLVLTNQYTQDP